MFIIYNILIGFPVLECSNLYGFAHVKLIRFLETVMPKVISKKGFLQIMSLKNFVKPRFKSIILGLPFCSCYRRKEYRCGNPSKYCPNCERTERNVCEVDQQCNPWQRTFKGRMQFVETHHSFSNTKGVRIIHLVRAQNFPKN